MVHRQFTRLVAVILVGILCCAAAAHAAPVARAAAYKMGTKSQYRATIRRGKSVPARKKRRNQSDFGVPFRYCLLEYGLYPSTGILEMSPYYGDASNTAYGSGLRWYATSTVDSICGGGMYLAGGTGGGWADTNMFGSFPSDPYAVALLRFSSNEFVNDLCSGSMEIVQGSLYVYLRAPRYQSVNDYGQTVVGDMRIEADVQGAPYQNWYYVMTCP